MNPSSRTKSAFRQFHGCDGDSCLSPTETWTLHNVLRGGARTRLCSSCLLLSHRAYYCCYCLLLVPDALPSSRSGDADNQLQVAPPGPTATCQVCGEAVAHLACLHHPSCVSFVCPACSASSEGRPFTYGPPCGAPLDERGSKVLLLGARLALALLQHSAGTAREEAVSRAQNAAEAKRKAQRAVAAAMELHAEEEEPPVEPWSDNVQTPVAVMALPAPPSGRRNRLDLGESSSSGRTSRVTGVPRVPQQPRHRHAMQAPPPPAQQRREARSPPAQPRRDAMPPPAQQRRDAMDGVAPPPAQPQRSAVAPPPAQHPQLHALPPLAALTIGSRDVTQLARAATEAARCSLPPLPLFGHPGASSSRASPSRATPPTLQLFPDWASSSSRATPRTLQLFQDSDDEEM